MKHNPNNYHLTYWERRAREIERRRNFQVMVIAGCVFGIMALLTIWAIFTIIGTLTGGVE